VTITVELPLETAELIDKALDRARYAMTSSGPEFAEESWAAQRADALVVMAKAYLSGSTEASNATQDNYQVTVHVDQAALFEGKGRSGLPIESVRRLACDADRIVIVENEDGEPLSVARKSRIVPTAIRRALWARVAVSPDECFHAHTFAEGILASLKNRSPESCTAMTASRGGP
jgi:hypothetical protein